MTPAGDAVSPVPPVTWGPGPKDVASSRVAEFLRWLQRERGRSFDGYDALWRWSVEELEDFWASVWHFFAVPASAPYRAVLEDRRMPGAARTLLRRRTWPQRPRRARPSGHGLSP